MFANSSWISTGEKCPADRKRNQRAVSEVEGDIPVAAHPARTGSAAQDLRRHSRPVLWFITPLWVRRVPARIKLPLPGRLRRSGEAIVRNNLPAAGIQNQVPGKLLPAAWQSRMRFNQPHLRLLRRMQATLQHQTVEDVHRLFQLPARGRYRRRKDLLLSRRAQPRSAEHGTDPPHHEADRRSRSGTFMRSALVGPR